VELVIGVICVILGAVVSGIVSETKSYYQALYLINQQSSVHRYYSSSYYEYRILFTTGEGIWCGVWVSYYMKKIKLLVFIT